MLLVGHQRGASRFMAGFMAELGFDTPHDTWGKDGMVTTMTALHGDDMEGPDFTELLEENDLIQFARSPRKCISTVFNVDMTGLTTGKPHFHWPLCRDEIGGEWIDEFSPLELAAYSYCWWHNLYLCHIPSLVVRVEHDLPKLCSFLGKEMVVASAIRTWPSDRMKGDTIEYFSGPDIHKYVGEKVSEYLRDTAYLLGYDPEELE